MIAAKAGLWAVGGSLATCALMIAGAGSWLASGFNHQTSTVDVAERWAFPAQTTVSVAVPNIGPNTGDENFWLSALGAGRSDGAVHKVGIGDHITINAKANVAQTLEVVDVKPIAAGLLPVVAGAVKPHLIIVTCKVVGASQDAASLVRFILEDAPSVTQPARLDAVNKAL
jgi:hypothetical protein